MTGWYGWSKRLLESEILPLPRRLALGHVAGPAGLRASGPARFLAARPAGAEARGQCAVTRTYGTATAHPRPRRFRSRPGRLAPGDRPGRLRLRPGDRAAQPHLERTTRRPRDHLPADQRQRRRGAGGPRLDPYDMADPAARAVFDRPSGEVTVQGILHRTETRRSSLFPADPPLGLDRPRLDAWFRVDIPRIQEQAPYPLLPLFLEAAPAPGASPDGRFPRPVVEIALSEGSHLFYL